MKKWWNLFFGKARTKTYLRRLKFALKEMEKHPEEGPIEPDRNYTIETVVWLIRYYKGDADAVAEGTPEIKLNKFLRTPPAEFHRRELIQSKILSHWNQYKHIEGY